MSRQDTGIRRATISDVAREAGVSPSTASVVFSGKTPVSEATRRRVLDAASALGYTGPDPRAASLRRGRSGIVGVVFEEHLGTAFLDPVKTLMMDGLADAVTPLGAGLLLLRDHEPTGSGPSLTTAPLDAAVLIGCSGLLRESLQTVKARGIPVVVIEGDAGDDVPRIGLDNREAQRQAASHLRALGHREVAIVTLPARADWQRGWLHDDAAVTVDVTRERLAGALDVFPDATAYAAAGSFIDEGFAAGREIFADLERRPTGVIAQSDLLAAGVIRAAEEAGLRVPEDVSVTGFDGIVVDGLAPYELTTLVQPATDKGRAAGAAVAAMLEGTPAASIRFTCTFREGNTTGPAPALV
ncbi:MULTISPECIES: LacI family DNA-binding transcriptional regulator [Microbacterium]|uniref:HTH-type transcriptional repressor CytR n=1 Tax=Microbacterium trichothecenolyticum TaxID=69370 RepID=A0A0M2H8D5_MICTR|nr:MULTISPECIES: LacI family DNA-binding transcriptional regulator [Microbacterium]KJL40360.1 HTH-type transcriptional repressor CytR [Microbacterium trichothecenolyticum]MDR7188290.1 DNA-binding LacI/PurR family transcriptional regulator [Microbacterium sp. BE35]